MGRERATVCSVLVTNFLLQRAQMKVGSEVKYHRVNTASSPREESWLFVSSFSKLRLSCPFLASYAGRTHMAQGAARPRLFSRLQ